MENVASDQTEIIYTTKSICFDCTTYIKNDKRLYYLQDGFEKKKLPMLQNFERLYFKIQNTTGVFLINSLKKAVFVSFIS